MSNFALASGDFTPGIEQQPVMSRRAAWALAGSMAVATSLLGVTSSSGLEQYCATREQLAPGGHASDAPLCDLNDDIRQRTATILDIPDFKAPFTIDTDSYKLFDQSS